jgi:TPR repeat protein
MPPDEHVQLGIDLHESGSLQESTYHLRLAANAGHPTGMLLFALACRHGWGMKANQKEGVMWLKKVTELASSEVADDEQAGGSVDYIEKKGRRAQFALSIYELAVSHMNGWGTEKDQGLALRCFEIAGRWGDPDALSEAGFCYANGVGCKKDLKKSAKFYRMAEAKGVNMVGNSWIWKDKYLDEEEKAVKKAVKKNGGGGKNK